MIRRWSLVAMLLAQTGCASGVSLLHFHDCAPYAGTRALGRALVADNGSYTLPIAVLGLLDLPLSFALDTALLPITVPCGLARDPRPWWRPTQGLPPGGDPQRTPGRPPEQARD